MTSFYRENVKCQNCDHTSEHECLSSTNQFGSVDLDTRPPEMVRSTLHVQVQKCPECGYCAANISEPTIDLSAVVASGDYQKQLNNKVVPGLANAFLCMALLQESLGALDRAGWAAVKAAWVCDDAGKIEAAKTSRIRAADLLKRAVAAGQRFGNAQTGAQEAILVDLLRRAEQFEEAAQQVQVALLLSLEDVIRRILEFQRRLIVNRDSKCYTVAFVLGR